jgi:Domain of unknown function (DUF6798)
MALKSDLVEMDMGTDIRTRDVILFASILSTLTILIKPYTYGLSGQLEQLPMVLRVLDCSFLTRDFFVNSTSGFNVRFYYTHFLALLGSFCPLPIVFLVLTWFSHFFTVCVTYHMARKIFHGSNLAAMIACAMIMSVNCFEAGWACYLNLSVLIPSTLVLPLALTSLYAGLFLRPFVCVWFAVAALILHPLVGLGSGTIALATMGITVLSASGSLTRRELFVQLGRVAAGAAILGAAAVLLWFIPYEDRHPIDSEKFIDIVAYYRLRHHHLASTWGIKNHITTFCFIIASFISWKWWRDHSRTDKALAKRLLVPNVIVLTLCIFGFIFIEIIPTRLGVSANLYRFLFILKWFGLIMIAGSVARLASSKGGFEQPFLGWLIYISSNGVTTVMLLFSHVLELFRERFKDKVSRPLLRLSLGAGFTIVCLGMVRYGVLSEIFSLVLFLFVLLWFLILPPCRYRSFIPLFLLGLFIALFVFNRYHPVRFLSQYLNRPVITISDVTGPEAGVAKYARLKTDKDAVFLTPPLFGRFRLAAERAIVIDHKVFVYNSDQAILEWKARMEDCYGKSEKVDEMIKEYEKITDEKIKFIAGKYGISYAALYKETLSSLPMLYENDLYKIVKVPGY